MDVRRVEWGNCDEAKRRMWTHWPMNVAGTWVPQVHRVCPHNEVAALVVRVLGQVPDEVFADSVGDQFLAFGSRISNLARTFGQEPWSLERTANSYSGALGRRYVEAYKSLETWPLDIASDGRLDCFLKAEKCNPVKKWPKPRTIFPRSPRYNLAIASRLKPFEHWLWHKLTAANMGLHFATGRLCAKGLNQRQRAALVREKMARGWWAVEVDGKAFEAHVGPAQLKVEHSVYRSAYPRDRLLPKLLEQQKVLKGRMPCGAKFSRKGGRASGDFNTGMGNSLVMLCVVYSVMHDFEKWDTLVDGDNALIFVPPDMVGRLGEVVRYRSIDSCGQELTVERPTNVFEEVVFGQSSPVWFPDGWRFVRNPFKALSGMTSSHAWLHEPKFRREYLAGVAQCELSVAQGQPLLQAACLRILRATGDIKVRDHVAFRDYAYLGITPRQGLKAVPIHPRTRLSFEKAFGVPAQQQVLIEQQLSESFIHPFDVEYDHLLGVPSGYDAIPGLPTDL